MATRNGHRDKPKLAVKQYIPLDNPQPREGDVTIVGAHANGFPKEIYEPLWDNILKRLALAGVRVRSIWIADAWNQGQSGVLNEEILGNDPCWFDHSRDLMKLINDNQDSMPPPLIGIGHSMGASQLAYLSLCHPHLFQSLVLIEPVIQRKNPGILPASLSISRRDLWPSRAAAIASFSRSKFYQGWDREMFDLWTKHGLRETPTALYPGRVAPGIDVPVTLTTSKHQELFCYLRPTYRNIPGETYADRDTSDDVEDDPYPEFYRPEPKYICRNLPSLRPNIQYIFGARSSYSTPEFRKEKLEATGTGIGGSGGVNSGKVEEIVLDCDHMVPMESLDQCSESIARHIEKQHKIWDCDQKEFLAEQSNTSRRNQITIDSKWASVFGLAD